MKYNNHLLKVVLFIFFVIFVTNPTLSQDSIPSGFQESDIDKLKSEASEIFNELQIREYQTITGNKSSLKNHQKYENVSTDALIEELEMGLKVIYGEDNRKDYYEFKNQLDILKSSESVASLFRDSRIFDNGNGTSTLITRQYGVTNNLCSEERFRDQPIGAFCSGFLVAPDIIATAGHCVLPEGEGVNLNNVKFVFGFRMNDPTTAQTIIRNEEIYRGLEIVGGEYTKNGSDWALVRLNRPVENHIPSIRRSGKVGQGEAVYVIGHPMGLPIKYADGAFILDNGHEAYFKANLDTYGGNSGSPVFDRKNKVVGILVRGESDLVSRDDGCNVSLICKPNECRGEDVTRVTVFSGLLPNSPEN